MQRVRVLISCNGESEVLRRVAILNAAMFRVIKSADRLVDVCSANYETGTVELLVEARDRIIPDPVPSEVTVRMEHAGPAPAQRGLRAVTP